MHLQDAVTHRQPDAAALFFASKVQVEHYVLTIGGDPIALVEDLAAG